MHTAFVCDVGGKSWRELRAELEGRNVWVTKPVADLMAWWKGSRRRKVTFSISSIADLGFTEKPTIGELLVRIEQYGTVCDFADGPFVRSVLEQQEGEYALCPVRSLPEHDDCNVYHMGRSGEPTWLDIRSPTPEQTFALDKQVVFRHHTWSTWLRSLLWRLIMAVL
ncbi:MAG TPA: hypothetical protein VG984_03870 [Candidatus Paceibacterota bacterium]|nr:hypothetical protein [Candidatus Paceibacterota bacterium]